MEIKIIKKPNSYETGGEINIKKSHEGLFTQKARLANMGVLEFASHVLANKDKYSSSTIKQAVFALNASKWHGLGGNLFNNTFAEGGTILGGYHTNGGDWEQPGNFHIIGSGGTHEENKNEGVQLGIDSQGVPNLVEENEVVYNDYVFSNRLTVPKRRKGKDKEISDLSWEEKMLKPYEGKTYADAALKVYKTILERPDDQIAKRGFETILGILANSQEKERAKKEHQEIADLITEMSGQEFAELKAKEEQLLELEQAILGQAMLQLMLKQQLALMSPEELQAMVKLQAILLLQLLSPEELLAMAQQQAIEQLQMMAQLPQELMANGGKLYALGGKLQPEESVSIENNLNIGQLNNQSLEAPIENQELISLEELELSPSFLNIEDVEDLSTKLLNNTIEEIILYARENKLKAITKAGRKAKKGSREDKEEFVEEAKDDINDYIEEQLLKQQKETLQIQESQQLKEPIEQELVVQELATNQPITQEEAALAELEAQMQLPITTLEQMQGLQFAQGGLMSQELLVLMQLIASMYSQYLQLNNPQLYELANAELQLYIQLAQQSGNASLEELQLIPILYYASRAQQDTEFIQLMQQSLSNQYAEGGSMSLNNPKGGNIINGVKIFAGTNTKIYSNIPLNKQNKIKKSVLNFLKSRGLNISENSNTFLLLLEEQAIAYSNNNKSYNEKDITKNGIIIRQLAQEYPYNNRANNNTAYRLRGNTFSNYTEGVPIEWEYTDSQGNKINPTNESPLWSPTFAKSTPKFQNGKWSNGASNNGEVFTQANGFYDYNENPGRDWSSYGYYNPMTGVWTDVTPNTINNNLGNNAGRYATNTDWFTNSGMNIENYEGSDEYINNYLDFALAINSGDLKALKRLYDLGEISKSNLPGERAGINRYFNTTKEGFDANNLSKDFFWDVDENRSAPALYLDDRYFPNFNKKGYVIDEQGNSLLIQYYKTSNGELIPEEEFKKIEQASKDPKDPNHKWAKEAVKELQKLPYKGLTRLQIFNHLKAARNSVGKGKDLSKIYDKNVSFYTPSLFEAMFDNNPALAYLMAKKEAPSATRYALVDEKGNYILDNGKILYINNYDNAVLNNPYSLYNEGEIIGNPENINGVQVGTKGLVAKGLNLNAVQVGDRVFYLKDELLKDYDKLSEEEIRDMPSFAKSLPGFKNNVTWYKPRENTSKKADPFPEIPNWPFLAGIGLQAGTTLLNALTPVDYSNTDAVINASNQTGKYKPIEYRPIGDYLTYKPFDVNYEGNKIRSAMAAERSILENLNAGNRGALASNILASDYNLINQLGDVDRKAAEANRAHEEQVVGFNRETNKTNAENFLKADMANQEALSRASQAKLEGLAKGYTMRQAAEDAKANAINASISGVASNLMSYAQNKYNQDMLGWGIRHGVYAPQTDYRDANGRIVSRSAKGGKLRTRRRGLSF